MSLILSDLLGTLKSTFKVNKANLDTSALSSDRTVSLPNKSGTVAMLSDISPLAILTEVPIGTVNGANTTFTLSQLPLNSELSLTIDGLKQLKTTDYSVSGTTITFVVAPFAGCHIEAFYAYSTGVVAGTSPTNQFEFVEVTKFWLGLDPLLIVEFTLPAGVYTSFSAVIGSKLESTSTTLEIKDTVGTVLKTLTRTGTPLQVSTSGFTLASNTLCGFYLRGDLSTTQSYIFSLGIK